jgi:predicted ATP-binding protein involved in virulence
MRITKIHLQNIGVFGDTIIEFPEKTDPDKAEIHILTGENGTGKSTVLYALAAPFMEFNSNEEYNENIYNRFRSFDVSSVLTVYSDGDKLFEISGKDRAILRYIQD